MRIATAHQAHFDLAEDIARARAAGAGWAEIGEVTDLSAHRARKRWDTTRHHRAGRKPISSPSGDPLGMQAGLRKPLSHGTFQVPAPGSAVTATPDRPSTVMAATRAPEPVTTGVGLTAGTMVPPTPVHMLRQCTVQEQ